jgi:uncharacterized protein YoxC
MTKQNKKADGVIVELNKDLVNFQKKGSEALNVFRDTVDKLNVVDEEIQTKVDLIETQIRELGGIKESLINTMNDNANIKSKFIDFLEC